MAGWMCVTCSSFNTSGVSAEYSFKVVYLFLISAAFLCCMDWLWIYSRVPLTKKDITACYMAPLKWSNKTKVRRASFDTCMWILIIAELLLHEPTCSKSEADCIMLSEMKQCKHISLHLIIETIILTYIRPFWCACTIACKCGMLSVDKDSICACDWCNTGTDRCLCHLPCASCTNKWLCVFCPLFAHFDLPFTTYVGKIM